MLGPLGATASTLSGTVEVRDGDDLVIDGTRIRLYGIDAPEMGQTCRTEHGLTWACGAEARQRLAARYAGKKASCVSQGTDKYGRTLGLCVVAGESVNSWMVSNGWAFAFRRYSMMFDAAGQTAEQERRGLHATAYQAPGTFRRIGRENRITQAAASGAPAPSADCQIKGNISWSSGTRIYHKPGQRNYDDTVIRPDKGEQWFCTTAQAEAQGWRAAKR